MTASVVLACRDGARFLEEQLASIRDQTQVPDELVVCDDGSTDDSRRVLADFARTSGLRTILLHFETSRGVKSAFRAAIEHAAGEIVFFCDQDDVWEPFKVERYTEAARREPELVLVASDSRVIEEGGRELCETIWGRLRVRPREVRLANAGQGFRVLLRHPFLPGHGMAVRRDALERMLPFPSEWNYDSWVQVLAAAIGPIKLLEESLCRHRLHSRQSVGVARESLSRKARAGGESGHDSLLAQRDSMRILRRKIEEMAAEREAHEVALVMLVDERIRLLEARAELRVAGRAGGARILVRELLAGRYHRVGRGWLAVARDLVALARGRSSHARRKR